MDYKEKYHKLIQFIADSDNHETDPGGYPFFAIYPYDLIKFIIENE